MVRELVRELEELQGWVLPLRITDTVAKLAQTGEVKIMVPLTETIFHSEFFRGNSISWEKPSSPGGALLCNVYGFQKFWSFTQTFCEVGL
jgi:hypothetical protein